MKTFLYILKSLLIVVVVIVAVMVSEHFLGHMWTEAILLILLLTMIVFDVTRKKEKHNLSITIHKQEVTTEGILAFLEEIGNDKAISILDKVDSCIQPPFAELNPEQQVMKSEENAIRTRLRETLKFLSSDTFKSWSDEKQMALRRQVGAMILYHGTLYNRCTDEGVLIERKEETTVSADADKEE